MSEQLGAEQGGTAGSAPNEWGALENYAPQVEPNAEPQAEQASAGSKDIETPTGLGLNVLPDGYEDSLDEDALAVDPEERPKRTEADFVADRKHLVDHDADIMDELGLDSSRMREVFNLYRKAETAFRTFNRSNDPSVLKDVASDLILAGDLNATIRHDLVQQIVKLKKLAEPKQD